jgi:hypothetical protein
MKYYIGTKQCGEAKGPFCMASPSLCFNGYSVPPEIRIGRSLKKPEIQNQGRIQVRKKSLFKKVIRFLFIGLWESTYRRKQQREIYNYHASVSPPRQDQLVYYSRYQWIRKAKTELPEED